MIVSAMKTAADWISAKAAESVEDELSHASIIDGAMTLALLPTRKIETPSSLTLAMKTNSLAAIIPGRSSGSATVRIRYPHDAPQTRAHSSRLLSTWSTTPARVRTPSGISTVKYANAINHSVP